MVGGWDLHFSVRHAYQSSTNHRSVSQLVCGGRAGGQGDRERPTVIFKIEHLLLLLFKNKVDPFKSNNKMRKNAFKKRKEEKKTLQKVNLFTYNDFS